MLRNYRNIGGKNGSGLLTLGAGASQGGPCPFFLSIVDEKPMEGNFLNIFLGNVNKSPLESIFLDIIIEEVV